MTGPMNGGVGVWGRGLRLGVCSQATSALAPLDRRLRSGLILRGPGQCEKPAPGTPEHRRRLCFFSGDKSGLDHLGSGRSGQVARVPDSEDGRRWRPSWLRMRPLPPHIVGWPGPHDWGTIGGGRTGRGIGSGGACPWDGTGFPVKPSSVSRATPGGGASCTGRLARPRDQRRCLGVPRYRVPPGVVVTVEEAGPVGIAMGPTPMGAGRLSIGPWACRWYIP